MDIDNDPKGIVTELPTEEQDIADIAALLDDPDLEDAVEAEDGDDEHEPEEAVAETEETEVEETEETQEEAGDEKPEEEPADQTDVELTLSDGRKVNRKQIEAAFQAERDIKAAFTPKFQEVAAARKELDTAKQAIAQQQQFYEQVVPFAQAVLQEQVPPPATEEEHYNDPIGAMAKDRAHQRAVARLNALQSAHQQHQERIREEQATAIREGKRQLSEALLARRSDLKSKEAIQAYSTEIEGYLLNNGFDRGVIDGIVDDKILQIVEKAAAYDKLKAKAPVAEKKAASAAPVAKPKARQAPQTSADAKRRELEKKLRQTGDPRFADALFMDLID